MVDKSIEDLKKELEERRAANNIAEEKAKVLAEIEVEKKRKLKNSTIGKLLGGLKR